MTQSQVVLQHLHHAGFATPPLSVDAQRKWRIQSGILQQSFQCLHCRSAIQFIHIEYVNGIITITHVYLVRV